uniref:Uncharacterized protein n=1 Tax=Panagrolaimus superbus TaxID=310955 RepID=A0A914XVE7_9BILA
MYSTLELSADVGIGVVPITILGRFEIGFVAFVVVGKILNGVEFSVSTSIVDSVVVLVIIDCLGGVGTVSAITGTGI